MKAEMVEGKGPTFPEPISKPEDIDRLKETLTDELNYFYDSIFETRHRLNGVVPLFGFSGGPWTLICYMIEGSGPKSYTKIKRWMYEHEEAFSKLVGMLANILSVFLINQIKAGAQMLQLFESNAGEICLSDFKKFILPALKTISTNVKEAFPDVPFLIFPRNGHHLNKSILSLIHI